MPFTNLAPRILSQEQLNFETWVLRDVPEAWLKKDSEGCYRLPELRRLYEGWCGANQWREEHIAVVVVAVETKP